MMMILHQGSFVVRFLIKGFLPDKGKSSSLLIPMGGYTIADQIIYQFPPPRQYKIPIRGGYTIADQIINQFPPARKGRQECFTDLRGGYTVADQITN